MPNTKPVRTAEAILAPSRLKAAISELLSGNPAGKWVIAYEDWAGPTSYESATGRRIIRHDDRVNVRIYNDAEKETKKLAFGACWKPASDLAEVKVAEAK